MMEISEIRKLNALEIKDHIVTEKSKLRRLKSSHALNPLDNPMRIRKSRRLIAQMETVLCEMGMKEIGEKELVEPLGVKEEGQERPSESEKDN